MKIDLPVKPPDDVKPGWPEQFRLFSWLWAVIGMPTALFMITTLKENGLPNVQLNCWGLQLGSGVEPKFLFSDISAHDTCRLAKTQGEFVVNFGSQDILDRMMRTIDKYADDVDEVAASGLTPERSVVVKAPRIKECFAHLECTVDWIKDVETHAKVNSLILGSIVSASIEERAISGTPFEAWVRRALPFYIPEHYDHLTRTVASDGYYTGLDLCPLKGRRK